MTCVDRLDALREVKLCHRYRVPDHDGCKPITDLRDIGGREVPGDLTGLLVRCVPEYIKIEWSARSRQDSMISTMEGLVGRGVDLISRGPASVDMVWRQISS